MGFKFGVIDMANKANQDNGTNDAGMDNCINNGFPVSPAVAEYFGQCGITIRNVNAGEKALPINCYKKSMDAAIAYKKALELNKPDSAKIIFNRIKDSFANINAASIAAYLDVDKDWFNEQKAALSAPVGVTIGGLTFSAKPNASQVDAALLDILAGLSVKR
jgi:hypothetical protein